MENYPIIHLLTRHGQLLAALLGAGLAFGVLLVVSGLERRQTSQRQLRTITLPSESRTRLARALMLGVPVLVATRWPVAAFPSRWMEWTR